MDALLKDFMRGTVSTVDSPIEVQLYFIYPILQHTKYVLCDFLARAYRGASNPLTEPNLENTHPNLDY